MSTSTGGVGLSAPPKLDPIRSIPWVGPTSMRTRRDARWLTYKLGICGVRCNACLGRLRTHMPLATEHGRLHKQASAHLMHTTLSTWLREGSVKGQHGKWTAIMPGECTLMSSKEKPENA